MHDAVVGIRSHKARQNMRLTKVTQPPAHQRNNRHEIQPFEHIHVLNALLLNHFQRITQPAHGKDHDNRRQDQGKNHQARLYGIGPAHREETADKGVENRRRRAGPQCGFIAHPEGALKQASAGHNPGGTVNGEEQQNHQRGDNPQHAAVIFEATGEIVRQG